MSDQPTPPPSDEHGFDWPSAALFPTTPAQVEPNAAVREMAKHFRACYIAFVDEGFSPAEAMGLVRTLMSGRPS